MALNCEEKSIYDILNEYKILEVPKYQRSYAWSTETVNNFVDDISGCLAVRMSNPKKRRHHFFGGIVSITSQSSETSRKKIEIIDGQQRLSTFVLLISIIVGKLRKYIDENKDVLNSEVLDEIEGSMLGFWVDYVMYRDSHDRTEKEQLRLKPTEVDLEFFSSIVKNGLNQEFYRKDQGSHKRLSDCWQILERFVEKYFVNKSNSPEGNLENLKAMRKVLEVDSTFIFISTNTPDDAYRYFLVLNDRGERLTTGDLLRARTLGFLEERKAYEVINRSADMWNSILKDRGKEEIERNFKWYFESMTGEKPKKLNLPNQYVTDIFKVQEIESESSGVSTLDKAIRQMESDFEQIRRFKDGYWTIDDNASQSNYNRERLRSLILSLKHTQAIPLLLALTKKGPKTFYQVVEILERFFFRFKTIGQQHVGIIEDTYREFCLDARETNKAFPIRRLRDNLRELVFSRVSDELFRVRLNQIVYEGNKRQRKDAIKVLLVGVENYWDWYEEDSDTMPICKDKERAIDSSSVTLEHIYPQTAREEIYSGSIEEVKHNIGNLTLLGASKNASLGNNSFEEKRDDFRSSNFRLNRSLAEKHRWTVQEIKDRQLDVVERAVKIFVP